MALSVRLLGSGSSGNAAIVRSGRAAVLLDAGLPMSRLEAGCRAEGIEPGAVEAVFLSHNHSDHSGAVSIFSRATRRPVLCSEGSGEALARAGRALPRPMPLPPEVDFGALRVVSFPVPHDVPNVGWRIEAEGMRVGFVTDLGHATAVVIERLRNCDILMIEANYDPELLAGGPYPRWLKTRISSSTGHLSNEAASELAVAAAGPATRQVVLVHLSERNNHPDLARRQVAAALAGAGREDIRVDVASRAGLPERLEL